MPGGNNHLANALSCPERRSDMAALVGQRSARAALSGDLRMSADQDALGTPNGRNSQKEAQLACESQESWMSQTLSVAKNQVRDPYESSEGSQERRQFPKA